MLDNVGSGLLAKLASEVSDLKCDFIAVNAAHMDIRCLHGV